MARGDALGRIYAGIVAAFLAFLAWFALSARGQNHKQATMAASSSSPESNQTPPRKDAKTLAAQRLAAALRENLKRRKQVARARAQNSGVSAGDAELEAGAPTPLSPQMGAGE
jgi:hypothetical protein